MSHCINIPQGAPTLRYPTPVVADDGSLPERTYGEPWTSAWQEEMEKLHFPGEGGAAALPDGVDLVGCVHFFDVSDVQSDGSRKAAIFYGSPMGMCKEVR